MSVVDPAAASFLVVAVGADDRTRQVSSDWVRVAERIAPTRLLSLDSLATAADRSGLVAALGETRVGARVMVAGGRYDVLQALAVAREQGAVPAELVGEITHSRDLPVYCAHCRDTHRVGGVPGGKVGCPGCLRVLEVHTHASSALGSYLASAAGGEEQVA